MRNHASLFMGIALFLASLNLRPAINSVSPLLQAIRGDLGMSAFAASLLTSIPVLCMGIFSPLAARLGRRLGIERVIGWSLAVIGLGNAMRIATHSGLMMLLTAFVAGVGIAAVGPLLSGFIKSRFPTRVPAMISLYTAALAIGATAASGMSIPLQAGLHAWQNSLAVWSLLALVAYAFWRLTAQRASSRQESVSAIASSGSKSAWRNGKAWLLTMSFGALAMLFYSLTAWLPPIVQEMGFGKAYAAGMLTLFSITQVPVGLLLPMLLKRVPSRFVWLLTGSAFLLVGFTMLELSLVPWLAVILIGFGPGILFPLNLMMPIEATGNAQEAANWSAMTQSFGYVIGAIGPLALGLLHDATGGSSSALVAGMMLITLAMLAIQFSLFPAGKSRRRVALQN
ncbi:CynX/NimT family MFS transporter [Cohnella caldifontis]|uniref:MFS transporter n=1 Tax=Cohnella caldifontis TaxID=3027471 RepID=UPI0023EB06EC|nr:MFS transporter [Cohnella sp. YIM B05605]